MTTAVRRLYPVPMSSWTGTFVCPAQYPSGLYFIAASKQLTIRPPRLLKLLDDWELSHPVQRRLISVAGSEYKNRFPGSEKGSFRHLLFYAKRDGFVIESGPVTQECLELAANGKHRLLRLRHSQGQSDVRPEKKPEVKGTFFFLSVFVCLFRTKLRRMCRNKGKGIC